MVSHLKKLLYVSAATVGLYTGSFQLHAAEYQPPQRLPSGTTSAPVSAAVIDQHIATPEEKLSVMEREMESLTGRLERLEQENAQLRAKLEGARTGKEPVVPTAQTTRYPAVTQNPGQPQVLPPLQEVPAMQPQPTSGNLQPQFEGGVEGGVPAQQLRAPQSMAPQNMTPPTMGPQTMAPQPIAPSSMGAPAVLPGAALTPTPAPQPKEETLPLVSDQQANKGPTFKTPKEQYDYARSLVMESKFAEAQPVLKDFVQKYPKHELNENALYWLGETYFVQAQYSEAAGRFAESYKKFPQGKKAPDTLLKLGMSLTAMGRKQDACLTYDQIDLTKKDLPANIVQKTQAEKQKAGCTPKQ